MGLRASSGSSVNKRHQPAGPPTLDYGSYFGEKPKCTWSESQEICSTLTSRQLILLTSSGAVSESGRLAETVGWGGHKGNLSPRNAFCFMETCPHLRGKTNREAVCSLGTEKMNNGNLWTYLVFWIQPMAQKSEQLGSHLIQGCYNNRRRRAPSEGRWGNVLPPRKRRPLASSCPLASVPLKGNGCPVGSSRK